jgi:hypothetical protein
MRTIYEGFEYDGALTRIISVEEGDDSVAIFAATEVDDEPGMLEVVRIPMTLVSAVARALNLAVEG